MDKLRITLNKENIEKRSVFFYGVGRAISMLGNSIYTFAIGLYVLNLTGSALSFATTIILNIVPMMIFYPLAGAVADRMPKKVLVVGMNGINGILFLLLGYISSGSHLNLTVIYGVTILMSIFTSIYNVSLEAAKTSFVAIPSMLRLNSIGKLIDSFTSILGPIIGGILYAISDIRLIILLNALSYILGAVFEYFIDFDVYNESDEIMTNDSSDLFGQLSRGLKYLWSSKTIKDLFLVLVGLNFLIGFSINIPLPYIINELLNLSSENYGLIESMSPVGLILGALTVRQVMNRFPARQLLITMNGIIAIMASFIGIPFLFSQFLGSVTYTVFYSVLSLIIGVAISYINIPLMTVLQEEIPSDKKGVVFGLILSLVNIMLPLGLLLSAYLIERIPMVILPALGAIIPLIYTLYLYKRLK